MPHVVRLRLTPAESGWSLALSHGEGRPVVGVADQTALGPLSEAVAALDAASPVVVIPGRDAKRTRAEEAIGARLGTVLGPEVGARLAWHLGHAHGRGEPLVLLVDAPDADVRALPWELIALDARGPLEASGQAAIARVFEGPPPTPQPGPLAVRTWCPDPDDDACSRRLTELGEVFAAEGLPHEPTGATLVHLVCHGKRIAEQVSLLAGDREIGSASASHGLLEVVRHARLVVLDVCEGGALAEADHDTLAGRLVAAGAAAVVAPSTRVSVEAAAAFSSALYRALATGRSVSEAVAAGRSAVRLLALPHADSRWTNFLLHVSAAAALEPLSAPHWRPEEWPVLDAQAAAWLGSARALAEPHGFVGLEHLVGALTQIDATSPLLSQVRFALSEVGDSATAGLAHLQRRPEAPADWRGTPRLRRLGRRIPAGASLDDVVRILWEEGGLHALARLRRRTVAATIPDATLDPTGSVQHSDDRTPAVDLEVLGGPEDGRRLGLAPGRSLGRWAEQGAPDCPLYDGTAAMDRFLSRRALHWEGEGQVHLDQKAKIERGPLQRDLPVGPARIDAGEVLVLGRATRLRGLR